ncbi:MAG: SDR family oxidoreductase [Burkholderiales bacterium]|jgi:3-oxoacyl-[acyl-carrier protein] reductase
MLEDKVVAVTGGSGGIGSEICRAFARAGATCIVAYNNNEQAANEVVESLEGEEHWAHYVPVDITAALEGFANLVDEKHGKLDVLVNCAGVTKFVSHRDLDALDDDLIDEMFRVNWRGSFAAVRAFHDLLKKTGDGLVVNISSVAGIHGVGSNIAYCASKAALDTMTKSLGRALAPEIRVVSVSPGMVETDFIKKLNPKWLEQQKSLTPMKRFATVEDVADTVVATATHMKFSTGCVIQVDGGRPLG